MPLKQTLNLMRDYGNDLINNTISDEDLDSLLRGNVFKKAPEIGYTDPSYVSDDNFSISDGIKDFVSVLAPQMQQHHLHHLTQRMIERAPDGGTNTFMRNSSLEKVLLAYEIMKFPESAEAHFKLDRMTQHFPSDNDIDNLKRVILKPIIEFFTTLNEVDKSPVEATSAKTNHSGESYQTSKQTLEQIRIEDESLKCSITKMIAQSDALIVRDPKLEPLLNLVLKDTTKLLTGQMRADEYQSNAKVIQGHSSLDLQALGALMISVGVIVTAIGAILLSSTILEKGQRLKTSGQGLFKHGHFSALVNEMEKLTDHNNPDEPAQESAFNPVQS